MDTLKKIVKIRPFVIFTLLIYSLFIITISFYHEPWRDEAKSWLMARDLDFVSLFKQMPYNGTPALWFMILFPFAKIGLPYSSMFVIHIVIAIVTVYIFLLYAPFSKITKLLFILSYYMAYEYAIIARNYNITIFLLFLIAAFYKQRLLHPIKYAILVLLLFNTNFIGFLAGIPLAIIFAWDFFKNEQQKNLGYAAILIMCLAALVSAWQLIPAPDSRNQGFLGNFDHIRLLNATRGIFFPAWLSMPLPVGLVNFLIFLVLGLAFLSHIKKIPALFFLSTTFSTMLYFFSHLSERYSHPRHHGLLLIILFFSLWISETYKAADKIKPKSKFIDNLFNIHLVKYSLMAINICLALSLIQTVGVYKKEVKYSFSGAKDAANFILRNHLDKYTIVAHHSDKGIALLPYLTGVKLWFAGTENYGTLVTTDKKWLAGTRISNLEALNRATRAFPNDKTSLLFLFNKPVDNLHSYGLKLLYKTEQRPFGYGRDEIFYLYKKIEDNPAS